MLCIRFLSLVLILHTLNVTPAWAVEPLLVDPITFSVRGQLRPVHHTVLAASMAGKLLQFPVTVGHHVSQGNLLVAFDCRLVDAEMAMVTAKLDASKATLAVNTRLEEMDNISVLEVELSRAEVAVGSADLRRVQVTKDACKIKAPFSGTVVDKYVQAHQFVAPGEPLLRLVDARQLEVEAILPSRWLKKLKIGSSFNIHIEEVDLTVGGSIKRLIDEVDPVSQTIRIIGTLTTASPILLPGMSGKLIFQK